MMANQFWSAIYTYILQNTLFGERNLYSVGKDEYLEEIINYTQMTWKNKIPLWNFTHLIH